MDSVGTLLESLRQCRALNAGQLDELTRTVLPRYHTDPRGLVGELLERRWLTQFQVNRLLAGRGSDLLLESYVLLDRIGEGGMGEVFKARNKFDKIVALKLIRKDLLTNATAVGRFRREIEATAQLDHPNIIRETDAGETEAGLFIVMDYVKGIDLGKLVRERGPLPPPVACDYIRQAARGLQHAHEKGLIHRDIKPGNLLRANDGHVIKILDLGLARLQERADGVLSPDDRPALTQLGVIVGTVDFLAPEQARDSRRVDARADLYSLGCTFFYLLTGQPPFPGGTPVEKLLRHAQEPPPALPQMPPAVMAVIHRLMAKKPEDRYQTAAEVVAALDELLARPEQLRASRSSDQLPPTVPLVALPPVAQLAPPRGSASKAAPRVAASAAQKRPVPAPPTQRDTAPVAPSRLLAPQPAPVAQIVLEPVPLAVAEPVRVRPRRSRKNTLRIGLLGCALVGTILGIRALSPSGSPEQSSPGKDERSAVAPPIKVLFTLSPSSGELRGGLTWSPEGKRLAFAAKGSLQIHEGVSGKRLRTLPEKGQFWGTTLAWGPEGSHLLAAAARDGRVRVWEVDTGNERLLPQPTRFQRVDFRGQALAFVGATLAIGISDRDRAGMKKWGVVLWDTFKGESPGKLEHESPVVALASQGQRLVSADRGGVLKLWEIQDGSPRSLKSLHGHKGPLTALALRADGRMLASAGPQGLFLWDVNNDRPTHVLPVGTIPPLALAFGPQDRLAWAGVDGRLHLCDTRSGTEKRVLSLGAKGLRLHPVFRAGGLTCAGSNGAVYHFSLSALDSADPEDFLLPLLKNARSAIRLEAIRAVASEGITAAVPVLEELLQGNSLSDKERHVATEALRKLKPAVDR
jgi:serine/threonine-protein kinase